MWVLVRPNRPNSGYWSDQPGRIVGTGQTKQADMWDWSDREVGTGQTEMWVLAKQNRLKVSIGQTKQTEMWDWLDQTDRKVGIGQTNQSE